jgi:3-phenylpropionate/trans-cinnamate dioxygenase ferredoxin component
MSELLHRGSPSDDFRAQQLAERKSRSASRCGASMTTEVWTQACKVEDLGKEDVMRFEHGARTLAIYRTADDRFFATDGLCTHEQADLTGGLVMGTIIECPKHNGRFDFVTGKAKRVPACIDLKTYRVRVENGTVFVLID